jgi:hypothetical protein
MSIETFTAEGSLYHGGGYYAGTSALYGPVLNRVWPSQVMPICGTGNYINCGPGALPGCTTNCLQQCQLPGAPAPSLECCPANKCPSTGNCCKKVCCDVTVT